eukprot:gene36943-48201_t
MNRNSDLIPTSDELVRPSEIGDSEVRLTEDSSKKVFTNEEITTASDMKQYLDDVGFESIIKPLLQRLLSKKPHEPVAFIINDLCSRYPNEAVKAVAALTKKINPEEKLRFFEHRPGDDLHDGLTLKATIKASGLVV